ncbi:hypothetical protein KI688_008015 [Linnemannia hyalina]|uniref:Uncharacterized protein n=1 Tax=Linnemannia hyalina TaxID=64524 RepID=A0A9P8BVH4_9FUNG|nr:hypothetical protein KI688_008015 [Linnemannia hyalina]
MKFKLPSRTTKNLRIALVTLSSSNSLIIVASIGFKNSSRSTQPDLLLIPQINVCIITIFYAYFKLQLLPFIYGQLLASSVLAGIFLFFAGKVIPLLQDYSNLFWVVQGFNVLLAILLLSEAICTFFVGKSEQELQAETLAANRRARATQDEAPGDNITTPAAVHLYQPRLDFSPPTEDGVPPHNRTSVISSSTADREAAVRLNIPDDYELDELPKYQRKPPAQSATIIDLSNLASVNPEVLNNVVRPLSSSSMSTLSEVEPPGTQQPPSALIEQGGQQSSRDEDVPSSDVPEYSPPQLSLSISSSSPAPPSAPSSGPTSLSPPSTSATSPSSHAAPAPEPPLYVP